MDPFPLVGEGREETGGEKWRGEERSGEEGREVKRRGVEGREEDYGMSGCN